MSWQDWLLAIAFVAGFGWAGTGDYDYRCKQAHDENPKEQCRMIAANGGHHDIASPH